MLTNYVWKVYEALQVNCICFHYTFKFPDSLRNNKQLK